MLQAPSQNKEAPCCQTLRSIKTKLTVLSKNLAVRGQWCYTPPHYREEECVPSLYKAWKPVPPGSVIVSPLLPHWVQTVSLCPPHLPSLWSETVLSSSLSLLDSASSTWSAVQFHWFEPAPFDSLTPFSGHGSRCQSPQRKVGVRLGSARQKNCCTACF